MTRTQEELTTLIAEDRELGLVTVACPKCGVTAGVLPSSDTWHATCDGALRMLPASSEGAKRMEQARERLKKARQRSRPPIKGTRPKTCLGRP